MSDLFANVDLMIGLVTFAVVALVTLSLVLLWEGVRRWLRSRAATRVLRKVSHKERAARTAGAGGGASILQDERGTGVPEWLEPILLRLPHMEDLQRLLDRAGSRWSTGTVILASVGLAVAFGLVSLGFRTGLLVPLLAAAAGAYLPLAYVKLRGARRMRAFEEHFAESIDLLARSARAGHSLTNGMSVVAEEAEEPVASEFKQVYEEQRFGLPLNDALLGLADRIDLVDVRIFVTAIIIQRESGGNLAENLDNISGVIRGRFRFKRDVQTKTAHGRITALVVGLAPVVAGVGMYLANPGYMEPLFVEPMGRMLLMVGAAMMVVGFFVIRRMAVIKI